MEIEYWKSRAAKMTLLVEQINSQPCRMTLVTLKAANCKLLKIWHDIDMRIAHYHVEACDNAKYLGATERYSHAVYLENPGRMKPFLMRLLYTIKTIYNVSSFYNNSVRVASFLVKITYQAIINCKSYITDGGQVQRTSVEFFLNPPQNSIWEQPLEVVKGKLRECITLRDQYRWICPERD